MAGSALIPGLRPHPTPVDWEFCNHSGNKYLLSSYSRSRSVPSAGGYQGSKHTKVPIFLELTVWWEADINQSPGSTGYSKMCNGRFWSRGGTSFLLEVTRWAEPWIQWKVMDGKKVLWAECHSVSKCKWPVVAHLKIWKKAGVVTTPSEERNARCNQGHEADRD